MNLIGLANECDGRADAGDVEDGGAFAPRFRFVPPQKDESRESLRADQREKSNDRADGTAEIVPVVRDEQDDTGARPAPLR